jgi:3alpha(or 20beta)-hydroxysteroid dehydrogenase
MGDMPRLAGKVAVISGAARGQGASHARRFVAEGAKVMLGDVLDDLGSALAAELGDHAAYCHLDVCDEKSWRLVAEESAARLGPPTVLVNNAGINRRGPITEQDRTDFEAVLTVNLIGAWLGIKTVAPAIAEAGGGSIVNISSTLGHFAAPNIAAYVCSKFGLRGLSKTAALELGSLGIRVNSVHPGVVDTPWLPFDPSDAALWQGQPISRVAQPSDVSDLVVYLASDESSYCTGAEFTIDGGSTAGLRQPWLSGPA